MCKAEVNKNSKPFLKDSEEILKKIERYPLFFDRNYFAL